jgi:hypothetical protein
MGLVGWVWLQPNDLWAIVDRVRSRVRAALGEGPSNDFFRCALT